MRLWIKTQRGAKCKPWAKGNRLVLKVSHLEGYATYPVTDLQNIQHFPHSTERTIRWSGIFPRSRTQRIDIAYTKTALSGFLLVAHSPQRWTHKVKSLSVMEVPQFHWDTYHSLWSATYFLSARNIYSGSCTDSTFCGFIVSASEERRAVWLDKSPHVTTCCTVERSWGHDWSPQCSLFRSRLEFMGKVLVHCLYMRGITSYYRRRAAQINISGRSMWWGAARGMAPRSSSHCVHQ